MEKCFIVTENSKLLKDYNAYKRLAEEQREFVNKFLTEQGIESDKFIVSGTGSVNQPFAEYCKNEIRLYIEPTEKDKEKFGKWLRNPNKYHGLCGFKSKSAIAKEFAQMCINNKVVINVHSPRIGEYFKDLFWGGYRYRFFEHESTYYLSIESEKLQENDIPEGMTELRKSEFYKIIEEVEEKQKVC
jgi:heat shock protein HspQ